MAELPEALTRHRVLIEEALRLALPETDEPAPAAARYVMGWETANGDPSGAGGKRIRPALCLLAAEVMDGEPAATLPGAVAIELVHNFSLVHDDVQDHDETRHGRPTAWTVFGEAQAINIGNLIYARAIRALAEAPVPAETRVASLATLETAIEAMIGGQWRDIDFEQRDDVTPAAYLEMVAGKTGALIGAPLEIGALLAGSSPGVASLFGNWGRALGLAFQVRDDVLGTWGDSTVTGKANTSDIARKKKTLPLILGLADPTAGPILRDVFAKETVRENDVARAVGALNAAGMRSRAEGFARRLVNEADEHLAALPVSWESRRELKEVGTYFVNRDA